MFPPTWVLVAWVYRASFESSRLQATPGECWLRLEVTDLQGRGLGFGRATLRHLARFLSLLPAWLGLAGLLIPDLPDWGCGLILAVAIALTLAMAAILIRTTPRRQALHDLVAKTIVLKREVEGA
jgi:uncharacterized RDD family membrane protein YckC